MLSAAALRASADATHERLGGPGQWLLALPAQHIAGVQVLLRSLAAGTEPVGVEVDDGFTPEAFIHASAAMRGGRRYTSLVPTQLARLLSHPGGAEALASLDGVLVGGAATPPQLLERARQAGVTALTTYGMSETAGGCVYSGIPLFCTTVRSDDTGRIHLGGATLASGYLGRPDLTDSAFVTGTDGRRWFVTDDVGHQDDAGRWHVEGRLDDLINSGGLKVAPRVVEEAIVAALGDVADVVVVGTPDAEWGQAVSAALVLREGGRPPTVRDVREAVRGILPDHALPRRVVTLEALPVRGPGKPDRAAIASHFATQA
jgi:O-succinylbenzoic acid--CoA ligase